MSLRRLLNLAYAHLTDGVDEDGRKTIDLMLREKFKSEMTPEEQKRAEAFRRTAELGGFRAQHDLAGLMNR